MNDWQIIFREIHPWDLTIATSNQYCSEFPGLLDFEHPLAFDAVSILENLTSFHFYPYFVVFHIRLFLSDGLLSQLSLNGIRTVPYFLKILWFLVFLTNFRNLFVHALKISNQICKFFLNISVSVKSIA